MTAKGTGADKPKRDDLCLCGHTYYNHDTGWDASGCMVGVCPCRSWRPAHD